LACGAINDTRRLIALADEFNRADDGVMTVPSEYLEVVITKR
jgi:hypothetical protein